MIFLYVFFRMNLIWFRIYVFKCFIENINVFFYLCLVKGILVEEKIKKYLLLRVKKLGKKLYDI